MAKNVEIKARAYHFNAQQQLAAALSDSAVETLLQQDIFFNTADGHLKLRIFDEHNGQLIYYQRGHDAGPNISDYDISETSSPHSLKAVLQRAYGIQAQVNKQRDLYLSGRTRIHFDRVEGLGHFIELEVVLNKGESLQDGEQEAQQLMHALNIEQEDLIDVAYVDLLIK